jgi:hypothetical protein
MINFFIWPLRSEIYDLLLILGILGNLSLNVVSYPNFLGVLAPVPSTADVLKLRKALGKIRTY